MLRSFDYAMEASLLKLKPEDRSRVRVLSGAVAEPGERKIPGCLSGQGGHSFLYSGGGGRFRASAQALPCSTSPFTKSAMS